MDRRDIIRVMGHWWHRLDEGRMIAFIYGEDNETEFEIPIKFEMCETCGGKGKHVNPSIDAHGITEDEWGQWGSEEQELYMSGGYDIECNECQGKRVIPVPVITKLTDEQQKAFSYVLEQQDERLSDYKTYLMESGIY
jgi:hypothetical protein